MIHSIDAEKAVLGGLLLKPDMVVEVEGLLQPSDFYSTAHQSVYKAILEEQDHLDVLAVIDWLKVRRIVPETLTAAYVTDLLHESPAVKNILAHAEKVKEYSRRRKIEMAAVNLKANLEDPYEDIDGLITSFERELVGDDKTEMVKASTTLPGILDELERLYAGEAVAGLDSGFKKLPVMGPGDLIVVGGRAAMGKTAFAMSVVNNVLKQGIPVAFISLEMTKEQLVKRLISVVGKVDSERLRHGNLTKQDFEGASMAMGRINKYPLYIIDKPGMSTARIRAEIAKLMRKEQVGLVVVDYLQKIQEKGEDRRISILNAVQNLKNIAKEFNIPLLALAQVNRRVEERKEPRPTMADLLESGQIEQEADTVLLLYREEYYKKQNTPPNRQGVCEVIVEKNRHGPTFITDLAWVARYTAFEEIYS